jgi:glyoxylase-like metal-dependent hydrolase (beta-lactamase superfamily II)
MTTKLSFKTAMDFAYGEPSAMAPGIVRVVANNPGPLTFKGTNTYLVGMTELAIIDAGPDDPAHSDAVRRAAGGRAITHIFLTHAHRDHVDGAERLRRATGARVAAFPRPAKARRGSGRGSAGDYVNWTLEADIRLAHGDIVRGKDWALEVIHTPGHAPDHVCLALLGRGVVFSGDHVMAWNTTAISPPEGNMTDYLRSLEMLLGRLRDKVYMPGHGGRLEGPRRTLRAYLLHRRWREQSVLAAIRQGRTTIRAIVPAVYHGLDDRLLPAAASSVLAHVERLIEQGHVTCEGEPTFDRRLSPA